MLLHLAQQKRKHVPGRWRASNEFRKVCIQGMPSSTAASSMPRSLYVYPVARKAPSFRSGMDSATALAAQCRQRRLLLDSDNVR